MGLGYPWNTIPIPIPSLALLGKNLIITHMSRRNMSKLVKALFGWLGVGTNNNNWSCLKIWQLMCHNCGLFN